MLNRILQTVGKSAYLNIGVKNRAQKQRLWKQFLFLCFFFFKIFIKKIKPKEKFNRL